MLIRDLSVALKEKDDVASKLLFSTHHLSHAASAFYPSPFEEAAVLTLDGVGEWTTCSLSKGAGSKLKDSQNKMSAPANNGVYIKHSVFRIVLCIFYHNNKHVFLL